MNPLSLYVSGQWNAILADWRGLLAVLLTDRQTDGRTDSGN